MTASDLAAPPRPDWRFATRDPLHLLALGCGSGLAPRAPGTAGSLFGWGCYLLLAPHLPDAAWAALLGASFALGIWICGRSARALRTDDPSAVVWDEIVAIWLVLWLLQRWMGGLPPWWAQLLGFALFRLFDAVKRGPVGWADRKIKGGLGIMLDDIVAAALALAASIALILGVALLHGN
jgi:phosphatidylglycerophosphatase A